MIILEKDKIRMKLLLQTALNQIDSIKNISLDIEDSFDIDEFVPMLLNDNRWAAAVDPILLADPNSESDKNIRANGIIHSIISTPLTDKVRFLDFGCGEGHVILAAKKAQMAVGYDLRESWNHELNGNQILTNDWEKVKEKGPYDVVLVYDVLDHVQDEATAIDCLTKIREVLSDSGKVTLRCHPWCSRHGTHLPYQINKAYLHLIFDDESLAKMGYKNLPTLKLIHPLNTYNRWIAAANLKQFSHNVIRELIESFFFEPTMASLIKKNWKTSDDPELASGARFPQYQLEQQFVDYVLMK